MKKITTISLAILIPLIVILINFRMLAFSETYYKEQFEKNKVYEKINKEETDAAARELINYLKEGGELETNYFNQKEKEHLKDVRNIIKNLTILLWISLIAVAFILAKSLKKMELKKAGIGLILGGAVTLLLMITLAAALLNFQETFIKFHLIFFNNNLWMLDPSTDKLIIMFPEQFFYEISQKIMIRNAYSSLGLIIIGTIIYISGRNLKKHKNEKDDLRAL